jgi:hypothetical protein
MATTPASEFWDMTNPGGEILRIYYDKNNRFQVYFGKDFFDVFPYHYEENLNLTQVESLVDRFTRFLPGCNLVYGEYKGAQLKALYWRMSWIPTQVSHTWQILTSRDYTPRLAGPQPNMAVFWDMVQAGSMRCVASELGNAELPVLLGEWQKHVVMVIGTELFMPPGVAIGVPLNMMDVRFNLRDLAATFRM